jgi:lipopolysaccharide transport system permease protein
MRPSEISILTGLSLAKTMAMRDLKNRYANTYGGFIWHLGVPFIYAMINVAVFSTLMKGRLGGEFSGIPFVLYYFVPFSLWTFFSEMMGRSTSVLRDNGFLINKIAFPAWVLPLIPVATSLLSQLVAIMISVILMIYFRIPLSINAGLFLVVWAISLIFTLGAAYMVAALSLYVPDLVQVVPVMTGIIFWLTPIVYPASIILDNGSPWIANLIVHANPFYFLVETARLSVFSDSVISLGALSLALVLSIMFFGLGLWIFKKLQPGFADVM